MHSFSPATPTSEVCSQLSLARYQLHCIVQNGGGEGRGEQRETASIVYDLYCLAAGWTTACKNRELRDLTVLI